MEVCKFHFRAPVVKSGVIFQFFRSIFRGHTYHHVCCLQLWSHFLVFLVTKLLVELFFAYLYWVNSVQMNKLFCVGGFFAIKIKIKNIRILYLVLNIIFFFICAQVKNFGRSGRTKYTHLMDQDTTQYEAPWMQDTAQNLKFHTSKGGGMKQQFERPANRIKKWFFSSHSLSTWHLMCFTAIVFMATSV